MLKESEFWKSRKKKLSIISCFAWKTIGFQYFLALHENHFVRLLCYTYWALTHIVCVIDLAGKQPLQLWLMDVYGLVWEDGKDEEESKCDKDVSTVKVKY